MCAALSHSVMSDPLWPHGLEPTRLLCPWGSSRQKTGVGCHALLQGFSQRRDRTQVFRITGRFFTSWATTEAQEYWSGQPSLLWGSSQPRNQTSWGLPHCRQILHQLSYQESPLCYIPGTKYYLNQLEYNCMLSHAQLIGAPWTVAPQALLSLEFPI